MVLPGGNFPSLTTSIHNTYGPSNHKKEEFTASFSFKPWNGWKLYTYSVKFYLADNKNTWKETIYGIYTGMQCQIQPLNEHQRVLWTCCYTNKKYLLPVCKYAEKAPRIRRSQMEMETRYAAGPSAKHMDSSVQSEENSMASLG